jgi:hypothetical protein
MRETHLFTLNATNGTFSRNAIHWPDMRKTKVRKACAAFSGMTNYRANEANQIESKVYMEERLNELR